MHAGHAHKADTASSSGDSDRAARCAAKASSSSSPAETPALVSTSYLSSFALSSSISRRNSCRASLPAHFGVGRSTPDSGGGLLLGDDDDGLGWGLLFGAGLRLRSRCTLKDTGRKTPDSGGGVLLNDDDDALPWGLLSKTLKGAGTQCIWERTLCTDGWARKDSTYDEVQLLPNLPYPPPISLDAMTRV